MVAASNTKGSIMKIGHFTKTADGKFTGSITAIGAILPKVTFEPISADGKGPDFVLTAPGVDLGAAWKKTSERNGKSYLSVSLKSPFLPSQVYAALVEADQDGKYTLIWNEPKAKPAD